MCQVADALLSSTPRKNCVEDEGGGRGGYEWLVVEVEQIGSVWEMWSDTSLNSTVTVGGMSVREVDASSGNLVKDLFIWGGREGGGGLEVKIESDGEGAEHRFDVVSAPVRVQFAPEPVLRLLNLWLTATYLDVSEAAIYSAAAAHCNTLHHTATHCNTPLAASDDYMHAYTLHETPTHDSRHANNTGDSEALPTSSVMPKVDLS